MADPETGPIFHPDAIDAQTDIIDEDQTQEFCDALFELLVDSDRLDDLGDGRKGYRSSFRSLGVSYFIDIVEEVPTPGHRIDWWSQQQLRLTIEEPQPDLSTSEYVAASKTTYYLVGRDCTPVVIEETPLYDAKNIGRNVSPAVPHRELLDTGSANTVRASFNQIIRDQFQAFSPAKLDEVMRKLKTLSADDRVPPDFWKS